MSNSTYLLGPHDQITVWALGVDELSGRAVRVDTQGTIDLPLIGPMKVAGVSVEQVRSALESKLRPYVKDPQVSVNLVEMQSQPVSIVGAVNKPGNYQLQGRKTLIEALSVAEGLRQDAGYRIKITRRAERGHIPLPGATEDPSGRFSIAEVKLKSLVEAENPEHNIPIEPYDVISVPRADLVYAIGAVNKAGGFVLENRETISILNVLALAGGVTSMASLSNAKIVRQDGDSGKQTEIAVNLKRILDGKGPDMWLGPDDILFVPDSAAKKTAAKVLDIGIQLGTGVLIWR
ncbi:MAG: polysaccharide biosynthesis/export family protein [Bryobacteraceae bacterium]